MKPCPDRKRKIIKYIAGGAGGREAEELEHHLRACLECADAADRLRDRAAGLDEAVRELVRRDGPSAGFEERLLAAIEPSQVPRPRLWTPAVAIPAVAVVLVIAALAAVFLWPGRNRTKDVMVEMSEWRAASDWLLHAGD
jgi:anti-sigma factor RsiW